MTERPPSANVPRHLQASCGSQAAERAARGRRGGAPSKVTSTFVSVIMGPILLAARKPMPPQASRHSCSTSTLVQVAAAWNWVVCG